LPLVRTPRLDSAEYLAWAQRLATGDWSWPAVAQHAPGYPIFLAALLAIGPGSLTGALVVQALLGAATAALVAMIARRVASDRAGWIAGLLYALYGPAVYVETTVLAEGLLLFLLVLALWLLSMEPLDRLHAAGAGAALAAATIVRPTALVIAVALLLIPRRKLEFILAFSIVLLPFLIKNWTTSGTLSLQGYGGLNVYIGNSPLHDGRATFRLGGGWDALNSEALRAGIVDPRAQDRYYLTKTAREIADRPAGYLKLIARKALWMIQSEEARDSHSYYFFAEQSPVLRVLPGWLIVFPLALAGPRRLRTGVLVFYTLAAAATVIFLVVGTRYRMPVVPALAIFAGIGVDAVMAAAAAREWRTVAIDAAVVVTAVTASLLLHDPRNRNVAEEWAFTGSSLVTERRLDEAEPAYRRAIALDSRSGLAWDGLGLALYDANRLSEAHAALERALDIDAENGRARFHLALVDDREGRTKNAAEGYERALTLSPYDADITAHLADARRKLAVELGMGGRTREARDEMRRVVELAPSNGEAWLDLCLLSLDLRDLTAATDALQRARANGANPERVAFADDALRRAVR
jgi:tetratricopeptide (TPR) repeat protein